MGSEQSSTRRGATAGTPRGAGASGGPSQTFNNSRHFDPLLSLSRDSFSAQDLNNLLLSRQDSVTSEDVDSLLTHDLPYVSYTVNRPIGGESPKKKNKNVKGKSKFPKFGGGGNSAANNSTLVVVAKGGEGEAEEEDPDLARLRDIPSFLPIMRATLSGSSAKDPDILERLDHRGLLSLTQRYQDHLGTCASVVTAEQADLTKMIREVDKKVISVTSLLTERQKRLAKCSERLRMLREMSSCLSRCHMVLNENIEQMEVLNNMLPKEERLEPFVWTTG